MKSNIMNRGGGRGRSATLPAWMTKSGGDATAKPSTNNTATTTKAPAQAEVSNAPMAAVGNNNNRDVDHGNRGVRMPQQPQQHVAPHMQNNIPPAQNGAPNIAPGNQYSNMPPPQQYFGQYGAPPAMSALHTMAAAPPRQHQQPPHAAAWQVYKDPATGRDYYHNPMTNATTFDKPDELKTEEEKKAPVCDWKEYTTPDGKKYWNNCVTSVSVWEEPPEFTEYMNTLNKTIKHTSQPTGPPSATPAAMGMEKKDTAGSGNQLVEPVAEEIAGESVTAMVYDSVTEIAMNGANNNNNIPHIAAAPGVNPMMAGPPPSALPHGHFNGMPPPGTMPGYAPNHPGYYPPPAFMGAPGPMPGYGGHPMNMPPPVQATGPAVGLIGGGTVPQGPLLGDATTSNDPSAVVVKTKKVVKKKNKIEQPKMNIPKYNTQEEKKTAFEQLLADKNVDCKSTWHEASNIIKSDPRFLGVGKVGFKKQLYAEWSSRTQKEILKASRLKRLQVKKDFTTMLEESSRINGKTSFSDAEMFLRTDPRFEALKDDDRLRHELFDDYIAAMVIKEQQNEKQLKLELVKAFENVLRTNIPQIVVNHSWRDAKELVRENPSYDALDSRKKEECYDAHMQELERKAKEDFVVELKAKINEGVIPYGFAKFEEVESLVEDLLSVKRLVGVRGEPTRTYNTVIHKLERKVKSASKLFRNIIEEAKVDMSLVQMTSIDLLVKIKEIVEAASTTATKDVSAKDVADVKELLDNYDADKNKSLVDSALTHACKELLYMAEEKERKKGKRIDRYKDLLDEFFYRTRHLDYNWDDAMDKMDRESEFRDMEGYGSLRKTLWEVHMNELEAYKAKKRKREDVGELGEGAEEGEVDTTTAVTTTTTTTTTVEAGGGSDSERPRKKYKSSSHSSSKRSRSRSHY